MFISNGWPTCNRKTRRRPGRRPEAIADSPGDHDEPNLDAIRRLAPDQFEVPRSLVEVFERDPGRLAKEISVRFQRRGSGKPELRIRRVRPGGAVARLGLRAGDIIRTVNGHPVQSPNDGLVLLDRLQDAEKVVLDIERRGRPRRLAYAVPR